uniref:ABC transporter ATP-binding protein n=1 Tax=Vaginimicrobium propionicum TaxID=1871034 RepID=UPI0009706E17|nr:ABC transporter ATP-binding protein [Vaginimicrobium propionicum]
MLLETKNLTRQFVRRSMPFLAVDDVTFGLAEGEFAAIIGRSGNGKTTFLNLVTGLLKPTSGSVRVDGVELSACSDAQVSRLRNQTVGFVAQQLNLIASLTVLDNVILPATMGKDWRKPAADTKIFDRALELLDRLDIKELSQAMPKEISGGEMRRVAIARALINKPALLIADEPTGDLDSKSTETVMRLFRDQANSGVAVLIVTHDDMAIGFSDRVYQMEKGRIGLRAN